MIPHVTLPVPFDDIPAEVERLNAHARGLQAEAKVTYSLVSAVQDGCSHPKEKRSTWTDYGGGNNVHCGHCGKEW